MVKLDSFPFLHHHQLLACKLCMLEGVCVAQADRIWLWAGPSAVLLSRRIKEKDVYYNFLGNSAQEAGEASLLSC